MAKYDALKQWLSEAIGDRTPLTFRELETLLGFPLPESARTHRPWWANTPEGHSHARAWLDAGWRTAAVDLEGARLVFERKPTRKAARKRGGGPARARPPALVNTPAQFVVQRAQLTPAAMRLLEDLARSTGEDVGAAAAALLNRAARRQEAPAFATEDWPA